MCERKTSKVLRENTAERDRKIRRRTLEQLRGSLLEALRLTMEMIKQLPPPSQFALFLFWPTLGLPSPIIRVYAFRLFLS